MLTLTMQRSIGYVALSGDEMKLLPALAVILMLAGCAASGGASLAETKSPTQLLHNEASSRLDSTSIDTISEHQDYSAACRDNDPDGLYRSWRSTLLVSVPEGAAVGVDQVVGALATSFAVDGWTLSNTDGAQAEQITSLVRSDTPGALTFTATEDEDGDGYGASVFIEAAGACVLTDGPDSTEVRQLER